MQSDQRDQLTLLLAPIEQGRRADRHVTELRDELELMLKAELMGRMGQCETGVGHRLDSLDGMGDLEEAGPAALTGVLTVHRPA